MNNLMADLDQELRDEIEEGVQYLLKDLVPPPNIVRTHVLMSDPLKNPSAEHGFTHVRKTNDNKFYCKYKEIHTGFHKSAVLAAYVLMKEGKRLKIEIPLVDMSEPTAAEPYPECSRPVPKHVDVSAIEYMRDPLFRSGYKGVQITYEKERTFSARLIWEGKAYRTEQFGTPAEAAWAVHTGKKVRADEAYVIPANIVEENFGRIDHDKIRYLANFKVKTGYSNVFHYKGYFRGSYVVYGVGYETKKYKHPSDAAWALHHHLEAVGDLRSTHETRTADITLPINARDLQKLYAMSYAEARKALLAHDQARKPAPAPAKTEQPVTAPPQLPAFLLNRVAKAEPSDG